MTKDNKKTMIVSVLIVVLFIVLVVATSYAYYTTSIKSDNADKRGLTVSTPDISATFSDNNPAINVTNMVPGDIFTKTFTLENTGNVTIKYKIVVNEVSNDFTRKNDIEVIVKENDVLKKTTVFPSTTGPISDELTIAPGVTKSYTVTIEYKNSSTDDQSEDMGKSISGKIFIDEV